MTTRRLSLLLLVLAVLGALGSAFLERGAISLFGEYQLLLETDPETAAILFWDIRLPRALLALMVGASLGLSGAALQGLTRNPLAEPGLIGASSGAALGAVVIFYFGLFGTTGLSLLSLPVGGLVGAGLSMIVLVALWGDDTRIATLVLAGVAINALTNAFVALLLTIAPSPFAIYEIMFWMMGSLADRSYDHVLIALPFMLAGWTMLLLSGRGLDAMTLGPESARSLGVSIRRTRFLTVMGTALCVGAAVSVSGVIGFVGLVVPHLVRPFTGHMPGASLLPSALAGAVLLVFADIGVRILTPGVELRLGVVTAFIGVPFFVLLLLRAKRGLLA